MNIILFIIIGYLFGSIPTALIVSKRKNIDIRKQGSGNIGGTNTFRVLGKKAGFFVSGFDILKGIMPTFIALYYGGETMAAIAGVSASIGHSYSIFAGFKGGKSVATSAGAMIVLSPISVLIGALVFASILFTTNYVSLSSMIAAASVVISVIFLANSMYVVYATVFFAGFIILRHHSNISRLFKGVENKAFKKKK